ncbi:glycosyltransferase family 4 protein [Intestinibacter sp.]|uniref:glycosyltransferase family 4 protein n=2 Tax=Intestinibacter TaxID=1505657 RepID=UPI003AB7BF44
MSEKKMKCLFLITGMPMGGAERVMSTLANELVSQGHQVRLITLKEAISAYKLDQRVEFIGGNAKAESHNRVIRFVQSSIAAIKGAIFYRKQLKEYNPDIVLSFLTNTNLLAVINNYISRKKYPIIISERCDPRKRSKLLINLCNRVYPLADCIVCQSREIENYFLEKKPNAITSVIPNPVNEECINTQSINKRKNLIVSAGRLNNQKNYDLLIDAFSDIEKDYSDYYVEIYGQGPEKDRLQEKVNQLGLQERILFKGVKTNVMKHISDAKLYIMSSDFEGFPNALVEAMASGLPVISTDFPTGVARELIRDEENGYVIPVGDRKKLSQAMVKIISNEEIQKKMSTNNVKLREQLNVNNIVSKWNKLFMETIMKEKDYAGN